MGDRKINTKIPLCAGIDWFFFFQIILLLVSPIPGHEKIYTTKKAYGDDSDDFEVTQYQSDYIFVFMFLRLSFLFIAYTNFSGYKTQFVKKICRENKCKPDNWFVIKLTFK